MIERWGVYELQLDGPADGNPYVDVELSAEFSYQNRRLTVEGFYDGGTTYRIRFMPDAEGTWSYVTKSNRPELDGKVASFECGPSTSHGPVKVADDCRWEYADGTPYLSFGTTCYAWIHQPQELQEETVRTLAKAPFNKLRMCVFPKNYAYNKNEPEIFPFAKGPDGHFDLERFELAFWHNLERRIGELADLGIEIDLILFHPYDEGRWGFDRMSEAADDRYLRYVVARLAAYRNIWWSLANEFDFMKEKDASDWERYFRILQERDPYQRPRSIHNGSRWYDHGKPWVTHASLQTSDMASGVRFREQYRKPIVYDECCYEGNIEWVWGNISAELMTQRFWDGFLRGCSVGHGETYLHPEDILWWSKGGTLHGSSVERIAFLRGILEDAPEGLIPDKEMFGWESGSIAVLSDPGRFYLIYFGGNQPARKELPLPAGSEYHVEVIDTWEMKIERLPDRYSGRCTISLPGKPYTAVRIKRVD